MNEERKLQILKLINYAAANGPRGYSAAINRLIGGYYDRIDGETILIPGASDTTELRSKVQVLDQTYLEFGLFFESQMEMS